MQLNEMSIVNLILFVGLVLLIISTIIRFVRATDKARFISTKLLSLGASNILIGGVGYFFGLLTMLKFLCFMIPIIGIAYTLRS